MAVVVPMYPPGSSFRTDHRADAGSLTSKAFSPYGHGMDLICFASKQSFPAHTVVVVSLGRFLFIRTDHGVDPRNPSFQCSILAHRGCSSITVSQGGSFFSELITV